MYYITFNILFKIFEGLLTSDPNSPLKHHHHKVIILISRVRSFRYRYPIPISKRYPVLTVSDTEIHVSDVGFRVSISGSDIDTRYRHPLPVEDYIRISISDIGY